MLQSMRMQRVRYNLVTEQQKMWNELQAEKTAKEVENNMFGKAQKVEY